MPAIKTVVTVSVADVAALPGSRIEGYDLYFDKDGAFAKALQALRYGRGADAVLNPWQGVMPSLTARDIGPAFEGRVIKTSSRTVRVMSDVWDEEYFAVVWTGTAIKEVSWDGCIKSEYVGYDPAKGGNPTGYKYEWATGLECSERSYGGDWPHDRVYIGTEGPNRKTELTFTTTVWTPDATPEVLAAVNEWEDEEARLALIRANARNFSDCVERANRDAYDVRVGADAVVVKGRKVKKGTIARIIYAGQGQYGPYVTLCDEKGQQYKFISTENVQVMPEWSFVLGAAQKAFGEAHNVPADVFQLLRAYLAGAEGLDDWGLVCDRIADLDSGDYTGYEFAEALRKFPVARKEGRG